MSAETEWLAFIDADCEVPENWSREWLEVLNSLDRPVAAIGGGNQPPEKHPFRRGWEILNRQKILHTGSIQVQSDPRSRRLIPVNHVSTTHAVYHIPTILKAGGFNEHRYRTGEDLELSLRLRKMGHKLYRAPVTPVCHHLPESMSEWLRKCFRYGTDQWPLLWKNGLRSDGRRAFTLALANVFIILALWKPLILIPALLAQAALLMISAHPRNWSGLTWAMSTQWIYAAGSFFSFFLGLRFLFAGKR